MVLSRNKLLLLCFYNLLLVQFGNTAKNSSPKPTFMTTVNIIKTDENSDGEEITDSSSSESITEPSSSGGNNHDRLSDLKIIDQMLKTYDRRATPTNKIGQPTRVECELFIRSFGSISEKTMDYQVDLYLRQHWDDPRLNNPAITEALDLNDPRLVQAIWKPEVYFPNAKEGEFQYVTVPNVLLRIEPAGHILYMLRLKMKFSCMMELNKYPLDVQVCTMEVASFSKTTRELILEWNRKIPVALSADLRMPQFTVERVTTDNCAQDQTSMIGNYSCLVAKFHLPRSIGFHMVQSYVPTILIVVISWVSFWMDQDSVPGRTTLGVTTLLTVSTKSAGLNAETPQVSYVKAIDVWMGACTAFIFSALIEFTIVNYLARRHRDCGGSGRRRRTYTNGANNGVNNSYNHGSKNQMEMLGREGPSSNSLDTHLTQESLKLHCQDEENAGSGRHGQADIFFLHRNGDESTPEDIDLSASNSPVKKSRCFARRLPCCCPASCGIAEKVDVACRILFPASFLLFNLFYWWFYLAD